MDKPRQYSTIRPAHFENRALHEYASANDVAYEVFMDDIVPRNLSLFADDSEKSALAKKLSGLRVKRIHCSYWASPTSFLVKNKYNELVERFGDTEAVADYFGDTTGQHIFNRWTQEYELAHKLGAQAYTFHLIDYAPVDGKWRFTIPRSDILKAMMFITQQFVRILDERGLLASDSPQIELENAGWGLEYGAQTAADYRELFSQIHDPYDKLRIGWDTNHLLHAVGDQNGACFMLPLDEITEKMSCVKGEAEDFARDWLAMNILDSALIPKIGAIHLSDCAIKRVEFFRQGKLTEPYHSELMKFHNPEEQGSYGLDIVLSAYDSHLPLGDGILNPDKTRDMILNMLSENPDIVVLHELKNSQDPLGSLSLQMERLWGAS